ncbi:MAG: hypothetical protein P9X24_09250 [Candidatus Hatepunaea meridiana]|nr:hypothetical protein [Candidatus Hatepunaea meridiana]
MAKAKTFAEKMLKSKEDIDKYDSFKVIEAKTTPKGTIRYDKKIVKVLRGDDEKKALGL